MKTKRGPRTIAGAGPSLSLHAPLQILSERLPHRFSRPLEAPAENEPRPTEPPSGWSETIPTHPSKEAVHLHGILLIFVRDVSGDLQRAIYLMQHVLDAEPDRLIAHPTIVRKTRRKIECPGRSARRVKAPRGPRPPTSIRSSLPGRRRFPYRPYRSWSQH